MSEHLGKTVTDRGFTHLPSIPSAYGGNTRVYESSAAMHPHIWMAVECPVDLNKPNGEMIEAVQHFRVEDAIKLAEQIFLLARDHYQDQEPEDPRHELMPGGY